MNWIEKLIAFLICITSIAFITFVAIKFRWILSNIEYISAYVKEYIISILAVKEKEYNKYKEKLVRVVKLSCAIYSLVVEEESVYKEYEKEKVEEFDKKLQQKIKDLEFEKYPPMVDEEYKKVVKTPLLKIYAKTIFGNVKSFDEFINKEHFDFIKDQTEKNRSIVNDQC
jgi:hypothetical protein